MEKKPKWTPKNASNEFTSKVLSGVKTTHDGFSTTKKITPAKTPVKRKKLTTEDYVNGILNQDRTILARAITLVESNSIKHMNIAQDVLKELMPKTSKSIRIGITGVPGAGKSTFIEAFGLMLAKRNHKVAVLAIDPTSSLSKGSVLGDKTRMEKLGKHDNCFIRPSPSAGALGGVTRKTRETILLCEAAGYDIILVETVGVGQNEVTVRSMVDFFLLLKIAGAGDELQGIKKGVIELADAILINKADGDNKVPAEVARQEFASALHYLSSPTKGWEPTAMCVSALKNIGIESVWNMIKDFEKQTKNSGIFEQRRNNQKLNWVHDMIKNWLISSFNNNEKVKNNISKIENDVINGIIPPTSAAMHLINCYEE